MLRLWLSVDWTAGRDAILREVAEDVKARQGNRILMVPELISHETERALCAWAGDTASRYAEVLSFTRLARRVAETMGAATRECLDAGGRLVAMAAAARQLHSRLKAYASVETKPEFLTGVIDGIDEFKRCCISPEDLQAASREAQGSLAQKLEELSLLMAAYDGLCAQGKRDPRDQMTWLLEQLEEGDYGEKHSFYIDGFPDFTRQNLAVLEHLIRVSPDVTVSLNCDEIGSKKLAFEKAGETAKLLYAAAQRAGVPVEVRKIPAKSPIWAPLREGLFQGPLPAGCLGMRLHCYRAGSPYEECMATAEKIRDLVEQGCRYRDITVVCTDMAGYLPLAQLVFSRFHIPLYQSGKEEILRKSMISTVLTALEAALGGFDQRETLRYLRSALSPLDPDTCDDVENYAVIWGIRGNKWLQTWENHPEGLGGKWDQSSQEKLSRVETARALAMTPLETLSRAFRQADNLRQQILALSGFLEDIQLENRLSRMAQELDAAGDNRSAQILNQLWEILLSALEQLYDVLGEGRWEPEQFQRLLALLLSQYDVGTIPPVLDAVQLGSVSALRCANGRHLFLLGAEEGKLPGYSGAAGVLSDQERVELRKLGVPLTGGAMEGIQAEFAEIYAVFTGAKDSITVFSSSQQPSFLFRRLSQLAGGAEDCPQSLGYALADPTEAGAYLAARGEEALAQQLGLSESFAELCRQRDYRLGSVEPQHITQLYGKTLQLSASQIDRQANCRLAYFLQYGLRAKERKEASVDPAEFGSYVHEVLERTAKRVKELGGFSAVRLEDCLALAHAYSSDYVQAHFAAVDSQRMQYLFHRNIQELDMVVAELWQELKDSAFAPEAFELGFGTGEALPPIALNGGTIPAILRGFVDRMDVWSQGQSRYYRIVDYKTGRKEFDYCDVFNGVGLQLLLYLFALKDSGQPALGEHPTPAGVQYFPARAPYLPTDGKCSPEEADKEREKSWKRSGLLLAERDVLQAMEPGEAPSRMDYKIDKEGNLSGKLADREQLKLLERYVFDLLSGMITEIASGRVDPNPYTRGSSHAACDYCPYGSICQEDREAGRRNYKTMTAQRFWEEVGKEVNHG